MRCYHLVYDGNDYDGPKYHCDFCPYAIIRETDPQFKYLCKPDYGENYHKCEIWKKNA